MEKLKRTKHQAENDARTILTIYGLRESDNETGKAGIFGFRTWWLSMDTRTQRAVTTCFKDRGLVNCYLRPDFLLNYIALSARGSSASKVFDQMFPTLIGVSLSHHVTEEMSQGVHDAIKRHKDLSAARVKAIIGSLSTQLMTEVAAGRGRRLRHVLDEAFKGDTARRPRKHPSTNRRKRART